MSQVRHAAFLDELQKIAATRYRKELERGTITVSDIIPGGYSSEDQTIRDTLRAPAEVSPKDLARKRQMSKKVYQTQMAAPQASGIPGLKTTKRMHPQFGVGMQGGMVFAPPQSGRFMRSIGAGPKASQRAALSPLVSQVSPGMGEALLEKAKGVDSTLTHAGAQHEFGEASELSRMLKSKKALPHASHLGVEPIIRENIAVRGDPEAVKEMGKLRALSGDDTAVQKIIRRAGGTPDAPLAVGGKQQRAVERMLSKQMQSGGGKELSPFARQQALKLHVMGADVGTMPASVKKHLDVSKATGDLKAMGQELKKGRLKGAAGKAKRLAARYRGLVRYLK